MSCIYVVFSIFNKKRLIRCTLIVIENNHLKFLSISYVVIVLTLI